MFTKVIVKPINLDRLTKFIKLTKYDMFTQMSNNTHLTNYQMPSSQCNFA